MTDATPLQDLAARDAPQDGDWRPTLPELRARLDGIDDAIHDLLIERAGIVEHVARSGKPAAFRPGREASMLRRLLARHTGRLPPRTIVRMWREMLAGTTAMQAQVSAAVFDTTPGRDMTALAREHFGALTPMRVHASFAAALAELRAGTATAAVLPFPAPGANWFASMTGLFIVARLPFWADRPEGVPRGDALVVATTPPDPSGADRSFIAFAHDPGLPGVPVHAAHGNVIEFDGLIAPGDPRLAALGASSLGGYAIPVNTP